MDTQLVEKIVLEVKSQGVFDEFRKDSIADVDTKPAYQNLRQRVENTVKKFLSEQKWSLETNKNQLREKLRKHITESGFLDVGVERIVDQVVNPKIGSVFQPRIEEIAYKYLGLPPPPKKFDPPPPPLMHPLPPLPLSAPPLKIETSGLLPTDLEQVSPDSDNATVKSEGRDDRNTIDMDTEDKLIDDEDESPPFEPLVKNEANESKDAVKVESQKESNIKQEREMSLGEEPNKFDDSIEAGLKIEIKGNEDSPRQNNFVAKSAEMDKEASQSVDARISQDSQLSSVSSDSRLSPNAKDDSLQSSYQEAVAANISEEAQMPKFNENSCEQSIANGNVRERDIVKSEFHFDIKKDEIKFEGTERKTGLEGFESLAVKSEEEGFPSSIEDMSAHENKSECFSFATEKMDTDIKEEDGERTPNAQELSFGSSIGDSSSVPASQTPKISGINNEKPTLEIQSLETVHPTAPSATPVQAPNIPLPPATPPPIVAPKPEKDHQSRCSSSSSSRHKKHSRERRRSHDREKDKDSRDRHHSSKDTRDSSKYHSSSGTKSSNKHSSSSSSTRSYSSSSKRTEKDIEKSSSSSAHSSSKHTKHSNSHSSSSSIENQDYKKHKRDSDRRHHSSSSSSKRSERKDDHGEAKQKLHRRKTDSNDDDDDHGNKNMGGSKSLAHSKSSSSLHAAKSSKSSSSDNRPTTGCKLNEYEKGQMETKEKECLSEPCGKMQPINNVVILNDLLENPQTQFIQLSNKGHLVEMPQQHKLPDIEMERNEMVPTEFNSNVELPAVAAKPELDVELQESHEKKAEESEATFTKQNTETSNEENETNSDNLLYFEEIHFDVKERLEAINAAMDLYRSAVNSLRFDSLSDEGIELSNEEDVNSDNNKATTTSADGLKRKSECSFEELVRTPRKRFVSNESESSQSKASPTPSDTSSANSKENEEICKNTNRARKSLLDPAKAIQKLSQQQRYTSEDLYKPRPILGQRSRRRGMDSLV